MLFWLFYFRNSEIIPWGSNVLFLAVFWESCPAVQIPVLWQVDIWVTRRPPWVKHRLAVVLSLLLLSVLRKWVYYVSNTWTGCLNTQMTFQLFPHTDLNLQPPEFSRKEAKQVQWFPSREVGECDLCDSHRKSSDCDFWGHLSAAPGSKFWKVNECDSVYSNAILSPHLPLFTLSILNFA